MEGFWKGETCISFPLFWGVLGAEFLYFNTPLHPYLTTQLPLTLVHINHRTSFPSGVIHFPPAKESAPNGFPNPFGDPALAAVGPGGSFPFMPFSPFGLTGIPGALDAPLPPTPGTPPFAADWTNV